MNIYTPFTYIIGWTKHKKFYYGCKFANGCQPSDLWESYFTSSNIVKQFREEYGEPDIIKIHRKFSDKESCVAFEREYLTKINAKNNPLFLNKSNGFDDYCFLDAKRALEIFLNRIENGTHPFSIRPDGTSINKDRVNNGTHHLLKRPDGTSHAMDRVNSGKHHWLQNKNTIPCYNKQNEFKQIPKSEYYKQTGPMEHWEWVTVTSNEGRKRNKRPSYFDKRIKLVPCYNKSGECKQISKEQYHSQTGPMEHWEWVFNTSKEGKRRKSSKNE